MNSMRFLWRCAISVTLFLIDPSNATPPASYGHIPSPGSADQIDHYRRDRAEVGLTQSARLNPLSFLGETGDVLPGIILGHFEMNGDINAANRAILDRRTIAYAENGTSFDALGALCRRKGDYDFALRAWVHLLGRYWYRPDRLWQESKQKLLHVLLNERGSRVVLSRSICGITVPETENHILMTESSRYLANQFLNRDLSEKALPPNPAYDNDRNGMNHWMRRHLAEFLKSDFSEYNSVPYLRFTTMPLLNLAEFADDKAVRLLAQMVLTSLDIKMALGSAQLLRFPPFRRRKEYLDRNDLVTSDGEAARGIALLGITDSLSKIAKPFQLETFFNDLIASFALSSYHVPQAVADWYFPGTEATAFHSYFRMRHRAIEIVSKTPEYIISAGGVPYPYHGAVPHEDGWAVPTMLIPAKAKPFVSEMFRFLGHDDPAKRSNTCVAPHFMCGVNTRWPSTLPERCVVRKGNWAFINGMSDACPELGWDVMLVVFHNYCRLSACKGIARNWGFAEAYAPNSAPFKYSFERFQDKIFENNKYFAFGPTSLNTYKTLWGDVITFRPLVFDVRRSSIESINREKVALDVKSWPYISGTHWSADGRGRMQLLHPVTKRRLVLSAEDPDRPVMIEPE